MVSISGHIRSRWSYHPDSQRPSNRRTLTPQVASLGVLGQEVIDRLLHAAVDSLNTRGACRHPLVDAFRFPGVTEIRGQSTIPHFPSGGSVSVRRKKILTVEDDLSMAIIQQKETQSFLLRMKSESTPRMTP